MGEYRELESLRTKLGQLEDSLQSFNSLHPATGWPEILAHFNTLVAKYEALVQETQAPILKQLLAIPDQLPVDDPDFLPRVLLRTKLIPEIEDEHARLLDKIVSEGKVTYSLPSAAPIDYSDETAARSFLRGWEVAQDRYEAFVGELISSYESVREEYDLKLRYDEDEEGDEEEGDGESVEDAMEVDGPKDESLSSSVPDSPLELDPSEMRKRLLESIVWMSSGPGFMKR
ncbi:hypothetical protein BJ742DRAFT_777683 [Cladochytrium replicatum]|nr:hypothetical protein BJ742DRAFT_777683 [Cladochytrium replicatum]